MIGVCGNSSADGQMGAHACVYGELRRFDGRTDALGENCRVRTQSFRGYDDEFLAAISCREVGLSDAAADDVGDRYKDFVARGMPMLVVHSLEVIQIDHDEGERAAIALRPAQLILELVPE